MKTLAKIMTALTVFALNNHVYGQSPGIAKPLEIYSIETYGFCSPGIGMSYFIEFYNPSADTVTLSELSINGRTGPFNASNTGPILPRTAVLVQSLSGPSILNCVDRSCVINISIKQSYLSKGRVVDSSFTKSISARMEHWNDCPDSIKVLHNLKTSQMQLCKMTSNSLVFHTKRFALHKRDKKLERYIRIDNVTDKDIFIDTIFSTSDSIKFYPMLPSSLIAEHVQDNFIIESGRSIIVRCVAEVVGTDVSKCSLITKNDHNRKIGFSISFK